MNIKIFNKIKIFKETNKSVGCGNYFFNMSNYMFENPYITIIG